jgi:hypothetical protein
VPENSTLRTEASEVRQISIPIRQRGANMRSHRERRLSTAAIVSMVALLGGLALAVAVHAQSTSTSSIKMVRGYQTTASTTSVLLMTIPGLGAVKVDCLSGLSRIAFFPSVSGSLWFTHEGSTGFASGSIGTQLSNQSTDDVITAQFATATQTATMVISGHPAATCIYAGQAIVQP